MKIFFPGKHNTYQWVGDKIKCCLETVNCNGGVRVGVGEGGGSHGVFCSILRAEIVFVS